MAVSSQWRTSIGGVVGLDYTAVRVAIDLAQLECSPDDFANLRILESAALREMRRRD